MTYYVHSIDEGALNFVWWAFRTLKAANLKHKLPYCYYHYYGNCGTNIMDNDYYVVLFAAM